MSETSKTQEVDAFNRWITGMPKAELHLHIDGTLEPQRLMKLAGKHGVSLPYKSEQEAATAYQFNNLDEFLALYYLGASVLKDEEDFYHLMMDYLERCREQNIVHCEVMVEPQTYAANGITIDVCMAGFKQAVADAKSDWGQSCLMILSILRHLPEVDGLATLKAAEAYRDDFVGLGLASSELNFPPQHFKNLYQAAHSQGYRLAAHAGEEGPPEYIRDALDILDCKRIDHGIRCMEDAELTARLAAADIPLTVCPLSNVRLKCFEEMTEHNLLDLLDQGLRVTVNSDDPAYFGGYLNENFAALHAALDLSRQQARQLVENGFNASYLDEASKRTYQQAVQDYWDQTQPGL